MSYNEIHQSPLRKVPAMLKVLFHTFMTLITGGLWLLGLIIWRILK